VVKCQLAGAIAHFNSSFSQIREDVSLIIFYVVVYKAFNDLKHSNRGSGRALLFLIQREGRNPRSLRSEAAGALPSL
jgi:hypothetical protein